MTRYYFSQVTAPTINLSTLFRLAFILSLFANGHVSQGQPTNKYPQDYFHSPLEIPLFLAGNFGEIRPNHFHAGLDLKTEGEEGKNILAAAEGHVVRIKIQHGGYGKVLYVRHPNGYTTAYAHLKRFNDEIEAYVQKEQYKRKTFTIELFPSESELKVAQGEIIALSGNTGGSGGPHLHFEIRKGDIPINPLLFGFDIVDNIAPKIKRLAVYPLDEHSHVNQKHEAHYVQCVGQNGAYRVSHPITVHGEIGLGVEVQDFTNGSGNRCGVYSIAIKDSKDQRQYLQEMEKVGFHETRYINSLIDYGYKKSKGGRIQKSFLDPNNKLSIYQEVNGLGHFHLIEDSIHSMKYEVKDTYGNSSVLDFRLKATSTTIPVAKKDTAGILFHYDQHNSFEAEGLTISVPSSVLYDNIFFEYKQLPHLPNAVAAVHQLHHSSTPMHKKMTVSIELDSLGLKYKNKVLAVAILDGGEIYPEGGKVNGQHITFKTRSFGPYTAMIDSVSPTIKPYNIFNGKNMAGTDSIKLKIRDNLSGIRSYRAYIDDQWVLFEFDPKSDVLSHYFKDGTIQAGQHELRVEVSDKKGNETTYSASFNY